MRTTLTLDDELSRELRRIARHSGRSFKEVVNSTLRRGLATGDKPAPEPPPFRVEPISSDFRAGVDLYRLNQLDDELEIDDFRREMAREAAGPDRS